MKRDSLCADDWLMHARSIRNAANRARLYGDAEGARCLMDAARAMEWRAAPGTGLGTEMTAENTARHSQEQTNPKDQE